MNKILIIAIIAATIICNCGGTDTTITQMSEEEHQRINSSFSVIGNTLEYAYLVSKKYSQSVPSTFTNAKVSGDYGTVTFSGTSSETDNRIILILTSKFDGFGSRYDKITANNGADTISLDKNSKQLLEYRTQLLNCSIDYLTGTGSFIGTIHFNPITLSKQSDTTTSVSSPYQITGLLQSSSYKWDLNEKKTFMTTYKN
ncbi:MAG: hypothetical protein ACM31E_11545 [Fibrobacterota bacterium]